MCTHGETFVWSLNIKGSAMLTAALWACNWKVGGLGYSNCWINSNNKKTTTNNNNNTNPQGQILHLANF